MATNRSYTPEEIILKLREVEVLHSQGKTISQACKIIEVGEEQTYYRWRKEYGGLVSPAGTLERQHRGTSCSASKLE